MIRGRGRFDPAEIIVWFAASCLALVCGVGLAFLTWSVLRSAAVPGLWDAGAYALAGGLMLLSPRSQTPCLRLALILGAVAFVAGLALGGRLFAPLALSY